MLTFIHRRALSNVREITSHSSRNFWSSFKSFREPTRKHSSVYVRIGSTENLAGNDPKIDEEWEVISRTLLSWV